VWLLATQERPIQPGVVQSRHGKEYGYNVYVELTENGYVSTREAADILGISLRSAQLWVENGVLTAWKTPGGHRRITVASIKRVLEERERHAQLTMSNPKLRVLIVEDDPDVARFLHLAIEQCHPGTEIHIASNGFEGLILVGRTHPDILMTDLNMPGMDGFRMIRAMGSGDSAPALVVAVTALSPPDISDRGGLSADIKVLQKPISLSQLDEILTSFIAQRISPDLV
jgi:excisionase family DNA binding protein